MFRAWVGFSSFSKMPQASQLNFEHSFSFFYKFWKCSEHDIFEFRNANIQKGKWTILKTTHFLLLKVGTIIRKNSLENMIRSNIWSFISKIAFDLTEKIAHLIIFNLLIIFLPNLYLAFCNYTFSGFHPKCLLPKNVGKKKTLLQCMNFTSPCTYSRFWTIWTKVYRCVMYRQWNCL